MEYRVLGRTGARVSALCLGAWMFGDPTDAAESMRILDEARAAGVNFVDTANVYARQRSEEILGGLVRPGGGRREETFLATKVHGRVAPGPNGAGNHRYHVLQQVEASLRRLRSDRIDLYYFHRPDPQTPVAEQVGVMQDLVRQGKIVHFGTSHYPAWMILQGMWEASRLGGPAWVADQPRYSLADRSIEADVVPFAQALGYGLVPHSPLAGGFLTGKYRRGAAPPGGQPGVAPGGIPGRADGGGVGPARPAGGGRGRGGLHPRPGGDRLGPHPPFRGRHYHRPAHRGAAARQPGSPGRAAVPRGGAGAGRGLGLRHPPAPVVGRRPVGRGPGARTPAPGQVYTGRGAGPDGRRPARGGRHGRAGARGNRGGDGHPRRERLGRQRPRPRLAGPARVRAEGRLHRPRGDGPGLGGVLRRGAGLPRLRGRWWPTRTSTSSPWSSASRGTTTWCARRWGPARRSSASGRSARIWPRPRSMAQLAGAAAHGRGPPGPQRPHPALRPRADPAAATSARCSRRASAPWGRR